MSVYFVKFLSRVASTVTDTLFSVQCGMSKYSIQCTVWYVKVLFQCGMFKYFVQCTVWYVEILCSVYSVVCLSTLFSIHKPPSQPNVLIYLIIILTFRNTHR